MMLSEDDDDGDDDDTDLLKTVVAFSPLKMC